MNKIMRLLLRNNILLSCMLLFFTSVIMSREPRAIITGDEMELISGGKTVIFTGNAKVVRGISELMADKIVQDKSSNIAKASGNIYFKSYSADMELFEARSGNANFFLATGVGQLWDSRPSIVYHVKGSTVPLRLTADKLDFDQAEEKIYAEGNVEILSSSITATSPKVFFNSKDKKFILEGSGARPKIRYADKLRTSEYEADKIVMYVNKKSADLAGNVKGKLYDTINKKP